uniref:Uncharacterized protein n=1 Tax=Tanacetum cinerariifolium TaxID=118510 RepID=A0A699L493_TANCI|nr:hypothetical protein [Tanacetum cinerariifolium]
MPPESPPHQPPPPPPPAGPFEASRDPEASGSSQVPPPPPPPSSTNQENQEMDEDIGPDEQAQSSDDEDIMSAHIPKTGDIATFMDWFCKRRCITELKPQDLEGPSFEIVKVFHPDAIHLQYQMEEYLEYLRYGSKGSRPALSISKMKATYYPDAELEQMVPNQFWIEEECKYDIAAMYGISHWWFQRTRFYIDRHISEGDRSAVRTHIRILNVVRIEVFSMYGYDYMKKIVLRRVDLNEHVIAERDFKQRVKDFQLGIKSYQTQLNLTKPQWDATGFEYKHDYTFIDSTRAVMFRDKYGVQMMMRFNEIHKFSDGMLQQIDEALDYRVKEFRINRMNSGLNMRFWTRRDVDQSKAFMFTIQKRLQTRRIFRNLESFVGRRVREGDFRLLKRTE